VLGSSSQLSFSCSDRLSHNTTVGTFFCPQKSRAEGMGGGGAEGLGGGGSQWDNVGYVHQLHLGTPMFTNWVVR